MPCSQNLPATAAIPSIGYRELPGHGPDGHRGPCRFIHKKRGNEVISSQDRLTQKRLDSAGTNPPHASLKEHGHHTLDVDDKRLLVQGIYDYIIWAPPSIPDGAKKSGNLYPVSGFTIPYAKIRILHSRCYLLRCSPVRRMYIHTRYTGEYYTCTGHQCHYSKHIACPARARPG